MTRAVSISKTVLGLACVALFATACAGSTPENADQSGPSTTAEPAVKGGTVVVRMAADPGCWDPFSPCGPGGSFSSMLFPKTVAFGGGKISATALLAADPVIEKGPPQRLTYKLNPRAVWSDGTPITSSDLRYTWDQGANGPGVANRTGWEQIASVDDSDPKTAVITFKQPYAAWTNPFGALGFVLPKHLLEGKERLAEMRDALTWSGGPWKIDRWTKGQEIRFVPNPNYWGEKPHLDALVFRIIFDAGAALTAYRSGQVSMIVGSFPPEITLAELQAIPSTTVDVVTSLSIGQLALNTQKPPLDSVPVRQALAYATDRDTLVRTGALLKPDIRPIHALMTPAAGRWYIEPFAKYRRDLGRVDQLMRGAGWTRGSDGIWAKGGQRAEIELVGPAGNKTFELTEQILLSQWKGSWFRHEAEQRAELR